MGLPLLFAGSLRIGSTIFFPSRILFGRMFFLVGRIIHDAMRAQNGKTIASDQAVKGSIGRWARTYSFS